LRNGEFCFFNAKPEQRKKNPLSRFISLELEVAGADDGDSIGFAASKWNDAIVEDGSLPDGGFEINTNPSNGDLFLNHIHELGNALKGNATVNNSCGMHCHIDASDYSWFDLFKLCRVYTRIEDALFSMIAPSRRGNNYCRTCADSFTFTDVKTFRETLIYRLYQQDVDMSEWKWSASIKANKHRIYYSQNKYHDARYSALNIHSFFYRGTVEFRHHQGCVDGERAANWGLLCAHIVEYAARSTSKQIKGLSGNSWDALMAILPESLQTFATSRRDYFQNR
jgi:hypothetical protein